MIPLHELQIRVLAFISQYFNDSVIHPVYLFKGIREILLVGHRQAFAWIDNWYGE